jgi:ABC-type multidrug transport system fused ATPase/permease subunit
LLVVIVVVTIAYFVTHYYRNYLSSLISETATASFQLDLYRHLQKLSADFYQRTHVGEMTARLTSDMDQGVKPFYGTVVNGLWGTALLLGSVAYLLYMNWLLFLLFLALLLVNVLICNYFIPKVNRQYRDLRAEYGNLNAKIVENVSAHSLIRAFAREQAMEDETKVTILDLRDKIFRAHRFTLVYLVLFWSFYIFFAPLMLLLIGSLFLDKGVTVGNLAAVFAYWRIASAHVGTILSSVTNLAVSFASFDRLFEFFDETPLVHDAKDAPGLVVRRGEIVLDRVSFSYPNRDDDFGLRDISLDLPAHTQTAFVGPSGAGKSTLAQLIMRLYDTEGGRITIDGQDISQVTQQSLRSQIGFVMQETLLLDGTFRTNMHFARREASESEIVDSLRKAELWDFVKNTPEGLDTVVGEKGIRLSGGQRQRLAIARVFLLEPPLVILDEPTSSLDAITEKAITETFRELLKGRTSIVIAHRVATVIGADRIAVMDSGRLVGVGTHRSLFADNEFYRKICLEQRVEVDA